MANSPINIDIIILSYAKTDELKSLTEQTISTLLSSEDENEIKFNVLVIESNKSLAPFQFEGSRTIYPSEAFGFNKYLNIGIRETQSEYICFCNNDLIFHKNWAKNLILQMCKDNELMSANPYCPKTHASSIPDDNSNVVSTTNGILIGWCIFLKRKILPIIGPLDENFIFWYSDNDYGRTLDKFNIKHALVTSSKVTHVGSKTHQIISDPELFDYTYGQYLYYDAKWKQTGLVHSSAQKLFLPLMKYLYLKTDKGYLHNKALNLLSRLYNDFL